MGSYAHRDTDCPDRVGPPPYFRLSSLPSTEYKSFESTRTTRHRESHRPLVGALPLEDRTVHRLRTLGGVYAISLLDFRPFDTFLRYLLPDRDDIRVMCVPVRPTVRVRCAAGQRQGGGALLVGRSSVSCARSRLWEGRTGGDNGPGRRRRRLIPFVRKRGLGRGLCGV